jgi:hypothetical protein
MFNISMMRLGRLPTAPLLLIAVNGISARPVSRSPSMLYETVAVRETDHGPERHFVQRSGSIASSART